MPITPHFTLSQDAEHIAVDISVPHVRVSAESVEVLVDGPTLHFASPPYLLVLTFPASFEPDSNEESALYDPSRDGGKIILRLRKQEPGLWPNLDLIGSLVAPTNTSTRRGISVMSSETEGNVIPETMEEGPACPDWRHALSPHYGFLNQFAGVFTDLAREGLAAEMLELPHPEETDASDRRGMRLDREQETFDPDRYLGDLALEDDYIFQSAMSMVPHWSQENVTTTVDSVTEQLASLTTHDDKKHVSSSTRAFFTEEEMQKLASIPYPLLPNTISPSQSESLLLGLVDILFAYVYDHLTTDGDPTIESSWTISTLSCTMSWLETYNTDETGSLQTVLRDASRRALIYPYIRNFGFVCYCWKQVALILIVGRRCIMRCLLQVRTILDKSECHYLGNRLYIDPYLAWLQRHATPEQISSVSTQLTEILENHQLDKQDLNLNLVMIEQQLDTADESSSQTSDSESDSEDEDSTSSDEDGSSSVEQDESDEPIRDAKPIDQLQHCKQHSDELLDSKLPATHTPSRTLETLVSGESSADEPKASTRSRILIKEI